ncbi:MAG: hypothetical protein LBI60_06745 [Bacteroidales bacterium]|jgi:hypothetical protein|nr:hypothetical protein [Bacteroidales bacterium]
MEMYIDASIINGYFDREFERGTKALFEWLKNKEIVFSILVTRTRNICSAKTN